MIRRHAHHPRRPTRRRHLLARAVRLRRGEPRLRRQRRPRLHAAAAGAPGRAGASRRRVLAGAQAAAVPRSGAARRGRDPVAQRPGLGHARRSARPSTTGCRSSAASSRAGAARGATCGRCARTCSCRPTTTDVRSALEAGVPAARVFPHSARASDAHPNEVRIAFDGDAVLFSDEAERVFQAQGLDAFQAHEPRSRRRRSPPGPFKPLLAGAAAAAARRPPTRCACAPRSSPRAARRRTSARSAR